MYNNFEISIAVFKPNITTDRAITYTNWTPLGSVTITYRCGMRYASDSLTQVRRPGAARYEVPRYENDRSSLLPKCTLGNSRLTSPRERTLGTSLSRSRSLSHPLQKRQHSLSGLSVL